MTNWSSEARPLDGPRVIGTLVGHGVQFVLVGGLAALAHGYTGLTQDADAVPAYDDENLARLVTALRALDARIYAHPLRADLDGDGAPPEAADFDWSVDGLRSRTTWQFSTDAGPLDILFAISGPGGYDTLVRNAERRTVDGHEVLIASLDDLIESKETAGRDKDLRALGELRRLRDAR